MEGTISTGSIKHEGTVLKIDKKSAFVCISVVSACSGCQAEGSCSIEPCFGLALIILAGIREQLELADIPKEMKGVPVSLVIAGILALAFMGFTGIVK